MEKSTSHRNQKQPKGAFQQTCHVTGLPITTKPEWNYKKGDDSYEEISIIGDKILFNRGTGNSTKDSVQKATGIFNTIILEHLNKEESIFIVFDLSEAQNSSLGARKSFAKWALSVVDRIELAIFYGMNFSMRVAIKSGKALSSKFDKVVLSDDYEAAMKLVQNHQIGKEFEEKEEEEEEEAHRIKELMGYLGKMSWMGDLDQDIPQLPDDDLFADLFAAVASTQDDLRTIEKKRKEAEAKLQLHQVHLEELVQERTNELKVSEEKYKNIFDSFTDVYYQLDKNSRITMVSPSVSKYGYDPDKLIGKEGKIFYYDEKERDALRSILYKKSSVIDYEYRIKDAKGNPFYISANIRLIKNDGDDVVGIEGVLRDVTYRKEAEAELKASEEQYRTLVENAHDLIWKTDLKGNFTYFNSMGLKAMGFDESTIGEDSSKYVYEDDLPMVRKAFLTVVHEKISQLVEFRGIKKDGQLITLHQRMTPIFEDKDVVEVLSFCMDITYRKKAEEEILKEKNFSESITQSMTDALIVLDGNAHIKTVNPATFELLGYSEEELIGMPIGNVFAEEEEEEEVFHNQERNLIRKDGSFVPVQISGSVMRETPSANLGIGHSALGKTPNPQSQMPNTVNEAKGNEQMTGVVLVAKDISELKKQSEEIKQRDTDLAFQAGLSEMGTNTLHNVGNAMTPVTTETDNLRAHIQSLGKMADAIDKAQEKFKDDKENLLKFMEKVSETLRLIENEDMKESIQTISSGVQQTLDIIRLQQTMASGSGVESSAFDLHSQIDDALFLMKGTFRKFGISVDKQYCENLETVFLPSSQLLQVVNNLLKNSKEAIHERMKLDDNYDGEIWIKTKLVEKGVFSISIKDNGCGIGKKELEKIFRHGFSTKDRGSGFGLDSVEKLISSMGGTINVNSDGENKGAEFSITLPMKVEDKNLD